MGCSCTAAYLLCSVSDRCRVQLMRRNTLADRLHPHCEPSETTGRETTSREAIYVSTGSTEYSVSVAPGITELWRQPGKARALLIPSCSGTGAGGQEPWGGRCGHAPASHAGQQQMWAPPLPWGNQGCFVFFHSSSLSQEGTLQQGTWDKDDSAEGPGRT